MPKKWQIKEKSDALSFGGKRTRGSGNKWYSPGDIKSDIFLIESKQTDKKSYSLSKRKLQKIYEEALFSYRIPLFSVRIQDMDLIISFKEDFEKLVNKKDQEFG